MVHDDLARKGASLPTPAARRILPDGRRWYDDYAMALDPDDIKKLDRHLVTPLVQRIEDLEQRVDEGLTELRDRIGSGLTELGDHVGSGLTELRDHVDFGLGELRDHVDVGLAEVRDHSNRGLSTINGTLQQILANSERSADSNERLRSSFERWFGERGVIIDEHEARLRALESWRETAEKKNGQQ